jgi:hypothetical protein
MKIIRKKVSKTYEFKKPPLAVRLFTAFLLFASVFLGLLKRWDLFGLSLGVLLITVILVCYMFLGKTINERFDKLEKLIKSKDENSKDRQNQ